MNEYTITPIVRTESDTGAGALQTVRPGAGEMTRQPEHVPGRNEPLANSKKEVSLPLSTTGEVFLKFQVNKENNEVTVYVVDRASRRVLRTIPPEEMSKLQAGDLLELLA
jgi:uncharacterized FlaG/YvyC family protein